MKRIVFLFMALWLAVSPAMAQFKQILPDPGTDTSKVLGTDGNHHYSMVTGLGQYQGSTVAPGANGNVMTSNGTAWTSAAPAGGGISTLDPTIVEVNGDYSVTAGTHVFLEVLAPAIITLPSSLTATNTVVTIQNDTGSDSGVTVAFADGSDSVFPNITGNSAIFAGDIVTLVPYVEASGQWWQIIDYTSGLFRRASGELKLLVVPFTATKGVNFSNQAAPGNPASGWTIFSDSGDGNKLKAKASTGTTVTLGTP